MSPERSLRVQEYVSGLRLISSGAISFVEPATRKLPSIPKNPKAQDPMIKKLCDKKSALRSRAVVFGISHSLWQSRLGGQSPSLLLATTPNAPSRAAAAAAKIVAPKSAPFTFEGDLSPPMKTRDFERSPKV